MTNNIENLYSVLKTFLPVADKYLANSPLEPYLPQIQNFINLIESVGGVKTLNSVISNLTAKNQSNSYIVNYPKKQSEHNLQTQNNLAKKCIDDYKRVN